MVDPLCAATDMESSTDCHTLSRSAVCWTACRLRWSHPSCAKVLEGLFSLCHRLFDVKVEKAAAGAQEVELARWHPDVEFYHIHRNGELAGHILIDPFVRPSEKRAGAWVQPMLPRTVVDGRVSRPVAAVVLNFPPPPAGEQKPALLSMGEVSTLFHEFGHAMQHVLTLQKESPVSGISGIEWDAVEVASQFMEYWPKEDKRTLFSFAQHYSTGEKLPEAPGGAGDGVGNEQPLRVVCVRPQSKSGSSLLVVSTCFLHVHITSHQCTSAATGLGRAFVRIPAKKQPRCWTTLASARPKSFQIWQRPAQSLPKHPSAPTSYSAFTRRQTPRATCPDGSSLFGLLFRSPGAKQSFRMRVSSRSGVGPVGRRNTAGAVV